MLMLGGLGAFLSLTVHLVGQNLRIPTELRSSSSDRIRSKIAFLFGESLINFVISKAVSSALRQTFDCLMVSAIAKLSA